jgi:hypothetical protein
MLRAVGLPVSHPRASSSYQIRIEKQMSGRIGAYLRDPKCQPDPDQIRSQHNGKAATSAPAWPELNQHDPNAQANGRVEKAFQRTP